jgi:hypothetical protein
MFRITAGRLVCGIVSDKTQSILDLNTNCDAEQKRHSDDRHNLSSLVSN